MRLNPTTPCPPVSLAAWLRARVGFLPSLLWNAIHWTIGTRKRWSRVHEGLWIGGLPFASDVPEFQSLGIRGVVNTCAEWPGPDLRYEAAGIRQCWLPTVDSTPPSLEALEASVAFMREVRGTGAGVYVHCKAGRGRSATVLLAYLISTGLTAQEGMKRIADARPHVNQFVARRAVIEEFERRHGKPSGEPGRPVPGDRASIPS